jgi:uncharacterized repeat protein (TIGR03803 family)
MRRITTPALFALALSAAQAAPPAHKPVFADLYNFTNTPDGANPAAGLVQDASGNLYGTTPMGGTNSQGAIVQITPAGKETIIYSFCAQPGCPDGAVPFASLIIDPAGNLYGTAEQGGQNAGTIFELSPASGGSFAEKTLYTFPSSGLHGAGPLTSLLLDKSGNLYGTAYGGACCGVVYELSPNGSGGYTQTVLYGFTGHADGGDPTSGVIMDASGNLYGVTISGGAVFNNGTLYRLSPGQGGPWTYTLIHSFPTGTNDGSLPSGNLAMDAQGRLFGTTQLGGTENSGAVFRLTPEKHGQFTETFLYSFQSGVHDGAIPNAGVILDADGNIYGTTQYGGSAGSFGPGTVFKLNKHFRETLLVKFADTALAFPGSAMLMGAGGTLYGTTQFGGATTNPACQVTTPGCGGVFSLTH